MIFDDFGRGRGAVELLPCQEPQALQPVDQRLTDRVGLALALVWAGPGSLRPVGDEVHRIPHRRTPRLARLR